MVSYRKNASFSDVIGVVIAAALVAVLAALLVGLLIAWPAMLIAGALHSRLGWDINYGFGDWLLIIALIRLVLPSSSSANKD